MTIPLPATSPVLARPLPANRIAAAVVIAFGAFCLWYSTTHDLVQDESYYWQWSRHLAFGYYDNTPLMAWLIHGLTGILGNTELGVRSGAVLCACVAAWFLYKLTAETLGGAVGLTTLAVALLNPLFGNGATLMSADPPQMAFWMLTAWSGWRAARVGAEPLQAWGWWLLTGALAGLTAMSKLNGLLVLPSVLLFLILDPASRVWLKRPQPYVAAALALLIFSPFLWWNHTHANAFWIHINAMGHRTEKEQARFTLRYFGEFLGAQAILLSPLLFLTLLWATFRVPALFRASGETTSVDSGAARALRYFWCLYIVVVAVTALQSLRGRVEGNWAVAAYLGGLAMVGYVICRAWESRRAGLRAWHGASVVMAGFLTIFAYVSTLTAAPPRVKVLDKRTDELYGWRAMAARVEREQQIVGGDPFVFGVNYRMPSEMAFYLPGQPQTYSLFLYSRSNEYLFWENQKALIGRNAVFVNDSDQPDHLQDARAVFRAVQLASPILIYRAPYAKPIRTIQVFRCYGFKGYDRAFWQRGW